MDDTLLDIVVLLGKLDIDYWFIETDPQWWELYLYIKRN